ncbi:MAG: NnrU family protein [Alphaproteobacteria bacterium]|nr:NnrU family protein [Alphaproteobacteria bacterium]
MPEIVFDVFVFVASHAVPALRPARRRVVARIGERAYLIVYSCISLGAIWWLAVAYAGAPYIELWPFFVEARWVPVLVMPVSCVLLVAGVSSPNPLSVQLNRQPFDVDHPGIVSVTRHPLIWAFISWAGAHLVPNGDAASAVLFGVLLVLSIGGLFSLDAKARAALGADEWSRLAAKQAIDWAGVGLWRVVGGLALYAALLFGHEVVIGISPFPF